jgi:hypothetical protein
MALSDGCARYGALTSALFARVRIVRCDGGVWDGMHRGRSWRTCRGSRSPFLQL